MPETLGDKAVRILNELDAADGKADRKIDIGNDDTVRKLAAKMRDVAVAAKTSSGANAKEAAEELMLRGLIVNYLDDAYEDRVATLASDASIKAAFANVKLDLRDTGDDESPQQQVINRALEKCLGKSGNSR